MRTLEAKPHTSVGRINEAQSHGEVCGVGRRPQQQQLVKEEEAEGGIPLHIAKCSQTGGGGGETTWPQLRPSVRPLARPLRPTIQQVWQSLWLPANQPSNRASEWFGLVALVRLPPAWLLTRFARLNANGRNSVHSPIDFPPIHFTHGKGPNAM